MALKPKNMQAKALPPTKPKRDTITTENIGGSWDLVARVISKISKVTIQTPIAPIEVLITLLTKSHDPLSSWAEKIPQGPIALTLLRP